LAAAYYLAKRHGARRVAVLERGWIGGGNTARNTTIVRSNYLMPESIRFYERSLQLYEGLSSELNCNLMLSQRGVVNLALSRHALQTMTRRVNALRHEGVAAEMLERDEISSLLPLLRLDSPSGRKVFGGFIQRRGGIVRHDAVAWGYARAASALGVDIVQNCEVTGFELQGDRLTGVRTSRRDIACGTMILAVAGHASVLGAKLNIPLPISSLALQAMVSEPVKPILNTVLDGGLYVSQSDHGELVMGGETDVYASYAQRGNLPKVEQSMVTLLDLFPTFGRLRLMRQWAGIADVTPDASPILGPAPVRGVFLDVGWGTYGFKAIPAAGECVAESVATGVPHPLIQPFALERFTAGRLIDEGGSSGMDAKEALL
jgi:sarcosine oxidase subunit beta